jgi:hypothetical protein
MRYSIVLRKSAEQLPLWQFDNLKLNGLLFVRTVKSGSEWIYTIGIFYNQPDAAKYLGYVKEKGYSEAYIVNQYDLSNVSKSGFNAVPRPGKTEGKKIFTIQVKATRSPVNMSVFQGIEDVKELPGNDGFFRYVTGEFSDYSKAKEALGAIIKAGFSDAFVRELNILVTN